MYSQRPVPTFCLCLLLCAACARIYAGSAEEAAEAEMARARKAWAEGDALCTQAARDAEHFETQEHAYSKAEAAFRKALEHTPKNSYLLADFGRFLIERKEFAQARPRLEAALVNHKHAKKPTPTEAAELADLHRALGGLLERAGESNLALEHYEQAAKTNPEDERNILSLATAFCAAGAPEEAVKQLQPWVEKAEREETKLPARLARLAFGFYTFALAREQNGFPQDALKYYLRAQDAARAAGLAEASGIAEHAEMSAARIEDMLDLWQARAQERARENEARLKKKLPPLPDDESQHIKACHRCDEGIRSKNLALQDPSFCELLMHARSNGGEQEDGELEKHPAFDLFTAALNSFQDARAHAPRLARAHSELGYCNLLLGRFSTARALLDAAVLYDPFNTAFLNLQGEILLEMGQWDDAAAAFLRALQQEAESARANFGLARAYAGAQRDERQCQAGLDALDRALQLGLRDRRVFSRKRLMLKSGETIEGALRETPRGYAVEASAGHPAREVARNDAEECILQPGLQETLLALKARFERGEKPPAGPVLRGSTKTRRKKADAGNPWEGSIFDTGK